MQPQSPQAKEPYVAPIKALALAVMDTGSRQMNDLPDRQTENQKHPI